MKTEEAIKWMEESIQLVKEVFDQWSPGECPPTLRKKLSRQNEVFELAVTALRASSDIGESPAHIDRDKCTARWINFYGDFSTAECSNCGELFEVSPEDDPNKEFFEAFRQFYKFCPACGRAMTEEAWTELERRIRR